MSLSTSDYQFLRALLLKGPIQHPPRAVLEGFQPTFKQCHVTAHTIAEQRGWPAVMGVEFLDLKGKLYSWPHMINRRNGDLIDFSGPVDQPFLGFIETPYDVPRFNSINAAYDALATDSDQARWSDPLARALNDEFYEKMRVMPISAQASLAPILVA